MREEEFGVLEAGMGYMDKGGRERWRGEGRWWKATDEDGGEEDEDVERDGGC